MRPSRFAPATVLLKMVAHVAEDTRQRIRLGREPPHARVAAPPAQLPSRVAAVGLRHGPWELLQGDISPDVCERFPAADARQHNRPLPHARVARRPGLSQPAPLALAPPPLV